MHYSKHVLIDVQLRRRAFADACNGWYLEFVRSERLHGDQPTAGFWFLDLLRLGVIGRTAMDGARDKVADRQAWLRGWGYGDNAGALVAPFHALHAGRLTLGDPVRKGDGQFMTVAQQQAEGVLIAVEPFCAAALFGLLAVEIFGTTGMRINEAIQIPGSGLVAPNSPP